MKLTSSILALAAIFSAASAIPAMFPPVSGVGRPAATNSPILEPFQELHAKTGTMPDRPEREPIAQAHNEDSLSSVSDNAATKTVIVTLLERVDTAPESTAALRNPDHYEDLFLTSEHLMNLMAAHRDDPCRNGDGPCLRRMTCSYDGDVQAEEIVNCFCNLVVACDENGDPYSVFSQLGGHVPDFTTPADYFTAAPAPTPVRGVDGELLRPGFGIKLGCDAVTSANATTAFPTEHDTQRYSDFPGQEEPDFEDEEAITVIVTLPLPDETKSTGNGTTTRKPRPTPTTSPWERPMVDTSATITCLHDLDPDSVCKTHFQCRAGGQGLLPIYDSFDPDIVEICSLGCFCSNELDHPVVITVTRDPSNSATVSKFPL
ncbi:unnamed protein product [Parascedosporium putredinis]|uniref:Uncharacterized protein n=1 Tax=Parascedosporium putredinis TaxID=1442378 RepID=A0A9P1HC50_9PEZI|nr:unnamed protein product [Parascedosporium putredinis]CAI8004000.1 unnamed protein product [Parascedosporium putredinis]